MRNIFKSLFLLLAACLTANAVWAQGTRTYTFDDGVALATDWTVEDNTASVGGKATCEIAAPSKFSEKKGNYLYFAFENKSGISIVVTSKESFDGISNITFDAVANDNSKPSWTLDIVDDDGKVVKNIYSGVGAKDRFNTGGTNKWGVSNDDVNPAVSGHIRLTLLASSSGKYAAIDNLVVTTSGPVGPVAVTGVTVSPTSTSIEAGQTAQLTATVLPANADNQNISWSTGDGSIASVDDNGKVTANSVGETTITVTTEDGGFTASCEVTVTAPPAPIEVESISMKEATTIGIGSSETLVVTYYPEDANTGKALTWKSDDTSIATVDANGKVTGVAAGKTTITATTANGKSATCAVTVQAIAVTGVSLDKTSATIKIGSSTTLKATVTPDNATNKEVTWSSDNTEIAAVTNGTVSGLKEGTATITATTKDGGFKAQCTVTVQEGDPLPPTTLTLHEPGIYDEKSQYGGYDTKLTEVAGREYEVYYMNRDTEGDYATITTTTGDRKNGIEGTTSETNCKSADGWFEANLISISGGTSAKASAKDEFAEVYDEWRLKGQSMTIHIKGYDQFSYYGYDKNVEIDSKTGTFKKNQRFQVFIDGVMQPETQCSQTASVRRYDITTGEHIIEVRALGDGDSRLHAFSLRVAQVPSVKHIKGNDSTQVVLQTESPRNITYFAKYNSFGETKLIWEDKEATGITLSVKASTDVGDTLVLGGQALCPVGVYPFHVSSFFNGIETKRLPSGKITVASDIHAVGTPEIEVYEGEAMEELEFNYHALSADDITLTWTNGTPTGISGRGENGKYYISGTPTQVGTMPKDFPFTISVKGGNSINGVVRVLELVLGDNPVLYLYTNPKAYESDGVMDYLASKGYDFVPRKALRSGLRPTEDYKKYNWVLISEDANADNAEVLALTRESAILPVLNMKSFSYAPERLGWGDPNNGSLAADGQYITVQRDDHPIFKALQKNRGSKIQVLSKITEKGLMPIDIDLPGTHSLATSLMRARDDYYGSGDPQTFLHEVPAGMRGGKKYICMPIAISSSKNLTTSGKDLIVAVVNYLLSSEPSIQIPQLQITSFTINGIAGKIDGEANKIIFEIDLAEHTDIDKFAIAPQVTIASDYTHVTPASGETIDFSESWSYPVAYEVSDFINRRVYDVAIRFYSSEGIEDVYAVGDWVNIYDIFGRKVSTTNEDIYRMVLPRGIYIIVTETGETFKIMR